ncbi:uncharacterized protein TRAVEDRAFT_53586 [Trametes versicolor FP-101664 SS1]|uniref:uncharacterized protein n=1 Tax=Trametes versicolor (strain FP-101664) TaxID=717944 RepID=UPI00046245CD|nr:uncharacterized protein TRAVEDRAFT_53586 [Trametes versicolor FP-101664 SS1]EIW52158.1 hypothetical protein TRAVEDRAFT_53586 [Trametes versicolor FP-101664 SS1]
MANPFARPTLSLETTSIIVSLMDIPSLMVFRATSKASLALVKNDLTRSLRRIVSNFVPNPTLLLEKLDRHHAFISGSVALQFFLRGSPIRPRNLDIFLPIGSLPPLFHHMLVEQASYLIHSFAFPHVALIPPHFLVEQAVAFQTPLGTVTLWQSEAHTAFLPIISAPTSIHILYVSPRYFGCGYPTLLFALRAIIGRPDVAGFEDAVRSCCKRGIQLRFFTRMWPDWTHHGSCAARYFACPSQQRTLSDAGSLKARIDPLVDLEVEPRVGLPSDYSSSSTLSDSDIPNGGVPAAEDVTMWDDITDSTPAVEIWVPNAFFHRLYKFLAYNDPHIERYNLADVPMDCQWGSGSLASRLSRNGRVVSIWAIGHLKGMWFFTMLQDPRPAARVCLDLLRDSDITATRRLMNAANPTQRLERSWLTKVDFCADRMDSTNRKVFREIYDARARYTAKHEMQVLPLTDLSIGDLVLVECWFVRSRINRDSSAWVTWTTGFQLRSVSLLLSHTPSVDPSALDIDSDDKFDGYM